MYYDDEQILPSSALATKYYSTYMSSMDFDYADNINQGVYTKVGDLNLSNLNNYAYLQFNVSTFTSTGSIAITYSYDVAVNVSICINYSNGRDYLTISRAAITIPSTQTSNTTTTNNDYYLHHIANAAIPTQKIIYGEFSKTQGSSYWGVCANPSTLSVVLYVNTARSQYPRIQDTHFTLNIYGICVA